MDVRCERCQTEYELEDASVSAEGTSVQCMACGNTFLVSPPSVAPATPETDGSPPVAEWLLETAEGPTHRFRNLTSLQKWIIERKVTREDRISRTGHAWRRLGDIVELSPFFDVVDQADQARADLSARGPVKGQPEGARRRGQGARPANDRFLDRPEPPTDVVRFRRPSVLRLVLLVVVAMAVAYAGISQMWQRAAPQPRPASPPVHGMMGTMRPVAATAVAVEPPPPRPAEPPRADEAAPRTEPAEAPPSYDKLIGEADHLLATGGTERARKLYDQALKLRPWGVEALSGLGYSALDRGRYDRAVSFFKRAVARAPVYGPALFGLGDAYRDLGEDQLALDHYRRFIAADPTAVEVEAAKRQIQTIEARLAVRGGDPATQSPP
jgi:predicted Zn finger-like uncharacterized protein